MNHAMYFRTVLLAATLAAGAATAADDKNEAGGNNLVTADLVATEIRHQGFPCHEPSGAVRDKDDSTPGETVWFIGCDNATYKVRLVPDMAAVITPVE